MVPQLNGTVACPRPAAAPALWRLTRPEGSGGMMPRWHGPSMPGRQDVQVVAPMRLPGCLAHTLPSSYSSRRQLPRRTELSLPSRRSGPVATHQLPQLPAQLGEHQLPLPDHYAGPARRGGARLLPTPPLHHPCTHPSPRHLATSRHPPLPAATSAFLPLNSPTD